MFFLYMFFLGTDRLMTTKAQLLSSFEFTDLQIVQLLNQRSSVPEDIEKISAKQLQSIFPYIPLENLPKHYPIGKVWQDIKRNTNRHDIYVKYLQYNPIYYMDYEHERYGIPPYRRLRTMYELRDEDKATIFRSLCKIPTSHDILTGKQVHDLLQLPEEYICSSFRVGYFWRSMKDGARKDFYHQYLESHDLYREEYERMVERQQKEKQTYVLTYDHICLLFHDRTSLPRQNEMISAERLREIFNDIPHDAYVPEFPIGSYWRRLVDGFHVDFYNMYLSHIPLYRNHLETVQRKRHYHYRLQDEQILSLFTDLKTIPSLRDVVSPETIRARFPSIPVHMQVTPFHIGRYWYNLKHRHLNYRMYQTYFQHLPLFRIDYEMCRSSPKKVMYVLTDQDMLTILQQYPHIPRSCEILDEHQIRAYLKHIPPQSYIQPFKIGLKWYHIKKKLIKKEIFDQLLTIPMYQHDQELYWLTRTIKHRERSNSDEWMLLMQDVVDHDSVESLFPST